MPDRKSLWSSVKAAAGLGASAGKSRVDKAVEAANTAPWDSRHGMPVDPHPDFEARGDHPRNRKTPAPYGAGGGSDSRWTRAKSSPGGGPVGRLGGHPLDPSPGVRNQYLPDPPDDPPAPVGRQGEAASLLRRLPEGLPRQRLEQVLDARDEVDDVMKASAERIKKARDHYHHAETNFRRLTDPDEGAGVPFAPDDPQAQRARAEADAAKEELDRLEARHAEVDARAAPLRRLVSQLEDWLFGPARKGSIGLAEWPAFKPKKGEDPAATVERLREERRGLEQDLREARMAPAPSAEALARIEAEIERLAERGAPAVEKLIEDPDRRFRLPETLFKVDSAGGHDGMPLSSYVFDAEAVFAWLHRDALLDRLRQEVERHQLDDSALSNEQRAARESELLDRILLIERQECDLVFLSALTVPFDLRQDPRAALGLTGALPEWRAW